MVHEPVVDTGAGSPLLAGESQPVMQLLVKVAARCNIDCSYCYWFRDASVYEKPKRMSGKVLDQLLFRLEEHILRHGLGDFLLILHGGEPMLWGMENFHRLAQECAAIGGRTGCAIQLAITTNGVLVDEAWADCFKMHDIAVTLSIDGPAHIHDLHRRTFKGGGTHAAVERAIRLLNAREIPLSALAVCHPAFPAKDFVEYFAAQGIQKYDILLPDATLEDKPPSVAPFFMELFDLWLEANRHEAALSIRSIADMAIGLLGGDAATEGYGGQPIELCTVMTDGSVEPHDVLRIAGNGSTLSPFNIFDDPIDAIKTDPRWSAAREASLDLADKCRQCQFLHACGGGYMPHRYSRENGYRNPSAYCGDLYAIYDYMQGVLASQIYVSQSSGERVPIAEAAKLAGLEGALAEA
jgi:uncharacterized protein